MSIFDFDLHTHTQYSDGRNNVAEMLNAAEANGVAGFVLADHVFSNQQAEKLLEEYGSLERDTAPVPYLFGCETAVGTLDGKACVSQEMLEKFELVLMDCNNILFSQLKDFSGNPETLCDRLCDTLIAAAGNNPAVTIMAHPFNFGRNPLNLSLKYFTDERVGKVAEAFRKNGKVFEIMNQMYYWHDGTEFAEFHREYLRIVKVFDRAGVTFSVGSDAHSCCGIGNLPWCRRVVDELKLSGRFFLPEVFRSQNKAVAESTAANK